MLARCFAFLFVFAVLVGPLVGLVCFTGVPQITLAKTQQKGMCLTTGVGCGAGHILLPAVGRM